MTHDSELKITGLTARPVLVPMARPLYTASGAVEQAALILIDIETNQGFTGRSYLFAFNSYTCYLQVLMPVLFQVPAHARRRKYQHLQSM